MKSRGQGGGRRLEEGRGRVRRRAMRMRVKRVTKRRTQIRIVASRTVTKKKGEEEEEMVEMQHLLTGRAR